LQLLLGTEATSSGPNFQYEWTDSIGNSVGNERMLEVFTGGSFNLKVTNTDNHNLVLELP